MKPKFRPRPAVVDTYELSPMQAGILLHGLSGGDAGAYIEQAVATLHEPLDEAQFLRAWQRVAERHPALRSRFRWEGVVQPVQEVVERIQIPVERLDWRAVAEAERRQRFQALLERERARGFELDHAPLMRLVLVRAAEREHWVLWTTHCGFLDGRSRSLLCQEVFTFYEAFLGGGDADLPLPRPYRDYIEWLRQLDYDSARTYWQGVLSGFQAPTPLVAARDREAEQAKGDARGTHEIHLPVALTSALRKRAREASVTVNLLLQAAWALLLHRYCGESDIVFGVTSACRGSALDGARSMVGLFINTLPIRVRIDPESELVTWLRQLCAQQAPLRDYEHTPLARIQGWSEVPRGMPLFESILVFDSHTLDAQPGALGAAWGERRFAGLCHTDYPLTVVADGDHELLLRIEYSRKRFDDAVVARMLGHLRTLLEGMAAHPHARLKDLALLPEAERRQLVELWNQTSAAYPAVRCVHELVEEQARIRPNALAAQSAGQQLTYRELDDRAERVAEQLRILGVQANSLVATYLERSIDMLVGLLAVWKAGGAYVPIDREYPAERVRFMLENTHAVVVLTQKHLAGALPATDAAILHLDAEECRFAASSERCAERSSLSPEQLAYVIYTSGSTGRPKGVPIKHASLFNLICWHQQAYEVSPADRATQIAGPAFDASVWEIWPYLTAGASVHIPDDSTRLDAGLLVRWLAEQQITLAFLPTPLAEAALRERWPRNSALRVLLTGGDRLSQRSTQKLPFRLVNHYGPTENTVVSTCAEVKEGTSNAAPPIGRPLPNTQAYVVDQHLQPLPIGVPGELLVGGVQLTSGYLNRPELTAEKFIPNPFSAEPAARLYKTGDLVRLLPDGNIEFLGRIDHQVKIRGVRIELGEIEAGIVRHPAVREVVVLAREDHPGDKRLVAYLVADSPPADLVNQVRALLRTMMPEHMVPAAFVLLDGFPLTPNGKLDRKALPAPDAAIYAARSYEAPVGDLETALAQIWCDVLKLERVGRHDNFFDLGGNSMMVVRLISEINRRRQVSLGPAELFRNPTVGQIAKLIDGKQPKRKRQTAIVQLRKGRAELPVYFIYAGPIEFRLANAMGENHTVLGIDVPWPLAWRNAVTANRTSGFPTMEQMVAPYVAALGAHAPASPCVLAGHSFAGLMAFEAAHQFVRQGGKVEMVMLLDTWARYPAPQEVARHQWRREWKGAPEPRSTDRLAQSIASRLRNSWRITRWLLGQEMFRVWPFLKRFRMNPDDLTAVLDEEGMPLPWGILDRAYTKILESYRPRLLESRGVLFRTDGNTVLRGFDDSQGWNNLFTRGLEIVPVIGDHVSMVRQHHPMLARQISEVLQRHWSNQADKVSLDAHERRRAPRTPQTGAIASVVLPGPMT